MMTAAGNKLFMAVFVFVFMLPHHLGHRQSSFQYKDTGKLFIHAQRIDLSPRTYLCVPISTRRKQEGVNQQQIDVDFSKTSGFAEETMLNATLYHIKPW